VGPLRTIILQLPALGSRLDGFAAGSSGEVGTLLLQADASSATAARAWAKRFLVIVVASGRLRK
jgi:hypothetical protein